MNAALNVKIPLKRKFEEIQTLDSEFSEERRVRYSFTDDEKEEIQHVLKNVHNHDMDSWPLYRLLDGQQRIHVRKLAEMAHEHVVVLDTSEAGTGKTYCSFGFAEQLSRFTEWYEEEDDSTSKDVHLFIISVKAVLLNFAKLAHALPHIRILGIANLECAILGKYYRLDQKGELHYGYNPHLKVRQTALESKIFQWKLPPRTVIVFDEAHRARNPDSQAFHLLSSLLE